MSIYMFYSVSMECFVYKTVKATVMDGIEVIHTGQDLYCVTFSQTLVESVSFGIFTNL